MKSFVSTVLFIHVNYDVITQNHHRAEQKQKQYNRRMFKPYSNLSTCLLADSMAEI